MRSDDASEESGNDLMSVAHSQNRDAVYQASTKKQEEIFCGGFMIPRISGRTRYNDSMYIAIKGSV